MKLDQLTIVTPTLNSAKTIRGTLDSVRPLVEGGAEHIVVDSGSTDGTVEIAKQFGSEVLYHPPGNMYAAINAGMEKATGEWLTYINSDDLLFADYVIEALEVVSNGVDVIYGDIDFIDDQGRFLFNRRAPKPAYLSWLMRFYSCVPQQGTIFRRALFERLGGFDAQYKFIADRDLFARALRGGARFQKFNGKSVAAFRLSDQQLSQASQREMFEEGMRSRDSFYGIDDISPSRINRIFASAYRRMINMDGILLRVLRGRQKDAVWRSQRKRL